VAKKNELMGQRFGRLVALRPTIKRKHRNVIWLCQCDCGNIVEIQATNLVKGNTRSCGCLQREIASKSGSMHLIHGDSQKQTKFFRLWRTWCHMKERCNNQNHPGYKNYGGRGIKVCSEWEKSYQLFKDWSLSYGYQNNLAIDRIDNDQGYYPENCQWITHKENTAKKTRDHQIITMRAFLLGIRLGRILGTRKI